MASLVLPPLEVPPPLLQAPSRIGPPARAVATRANWPPRARNSRRESTLKPFSVMIPLLNHRCDDLIHAGPVPRRSRWLSTSFRSWPVDSALPHQSTHDGRGDRLGRELAEQPPFRPP